MIMHFPVRRLVLSYAIAAGGVLLAGLSHWWLAPILQDSPPMRLLLVLVVMASAWLGGLWPGLFASALGLLAIIAANDAPGDLASLGTRIVRFGSLAVLITWLFTGIHSFRHRARREHSRYDGGDDTRGGFRARRRYVQRRTRAWARLCRHRGLNTAGLSEEDRRCSMALFGAWRSRS